MLRCLAKAPAGRPQSYAELADLLRPYVSADEVPSPLGARFIAWIADSVIVSIMTWLLVSSAWTVGVTLGSATTLLRLAAWSWLASVIYYFVLEGGWGASLGKRLMGLRVTSQTRAMRWWLRVGLRTAVFHVPTVIPTLFFMGATRGSTVPGVVYTANLRRTDGPGMSPDALLSLLLTILLFSTARRGNGWTGVHELLSRTRVVQRNVRPVASAAPKASPADLVPALSSLRRVGPYAVHTMVGETGGGRLFVGIDPILRRHVWIHEVPPGTPPVEATRRDVSRPGRLLARGTPIGDGELGRVRGAEGRAIPDRRRRRPIGARCIVRSRAWRPSSMPQLAKTGWTHGSLSPKCGGERTDTSCSSISPWPATGRAGRQSDSQSCRAAGGRLHARMLLHHRSRPRRCRARRC